MTVFAPIIIFTGRSGVGKTTFLEKLIPVLKRRGLRIAVLKHDAHHFEMDKPGKDTWRFTQAGADVSAISNASGFALVERTQRQLTLEKLVERLPDADLVLTEGYKRAHYPKIELHRACPGAPLLSRPEELLAVITDEPMDIDVPQFDPEDAEGCADLIVDYLFRRQAGNLDGW